MLEDIKKFIEEISQIEVIANNASLSSNVHFSNKHIGIYYSYFVDEITNRMGIIVRPQKGLDTEDSSEEELESTYKHLRRLYKISHYQNDYFGEVYLCYTSGFIPNDFAAMVESMIDCLIVAKIDEQYKVIMHAGLDPETDKWMDFVGSEHISLKKPGKLMSIERLIEPIDDDDEMAKYLAEE